MPGLWEVVGGGDKGGILVRSGRETASPQEQERLSTGSRVEELELVGDRLHYRLLAGTGPQEGWVSVKVSGKVLVVPREAPPEEAPAELGRSPREAPQAGLVELQAHEVRIGELGLGAVAHCRPEGAPRAPLAVLLVPGNPVINSYHAGMPMMLALEEAFVRIGVPTLRFDYDGVGMSAPGQEPPCQEYRVTLRDTRSAAEWAKFFLSDRIVACGWNYGGSTATWLARENFPGLHALQFVSWGYNIWMMLKQMGDPGWSELRDEYDAHATLTHPAMYVFGEKDSFTPKGHVNRVVKSRPDGGAGAPVHMLRQPEGLNKTEYFQLRGQEQEAAELCATWVKGLNDELLLAESTLLGA